MKSGSAKSYVFVFILFIILTGYWLCSIFIGSHEFQLSEVRQLTKVQGEKQLQEFNAFDSLVTEFISHVSVDFGKSVTLFEQINNGNISFPVNYIDEFNVISAKVFYNLDNEEYLRQSLLHMDEGADKLILNAGLLIRKDSLDKAIKFLRKSSAMNESNIWFVGNWYEIVGNRQMAINRYNKLSLVKGLTCEKCLTRIRELQNGAVLTNELLFDDTHRFMKSIVDPAADLEYPNELMIAKFRHLEKKYQVAFD